MSSTRAGAPRRLLYLGTPEMAVAPLDALVGAGFDVVGVVTRPDARRGRGRELSPSPVGARAAALGIPVVHSMHDGSSLAVATGADLGVVVAYGRLIPAASLQMLPMVNLHFSLLPRWRGAAPVERALLAGDDITGVCLMQLDEGLDTGPVHACRETSIGSEETGASLRSRLVTMGSALLVDELRQGLAAPTPQRGEPTYAAKLAADDLRLDWDAPARERHRVVRLGGAWTLLRGKRLKILSAAIVDPAADGDVLDGDVVGGLRLMRVQPEGRPEMEFSAFANGARLVAGERLATTA